MREFLPHVVDGHARGNDGQIEVRGLRFDGPDRLHWIGAGLDQETHVLKGLAGEHPQLRVLHQEEHACGPSGILRLDRIGSGLVGLDHGKVHSEDGAPTRLALHRHPPPMVPQATARRADSKTGSLSWFLGGEEGFLDVGEGLFRHTHACVADVDHNETPSELGKAIVARRMIFAQQGFDGQNSSNWHGIPGIDQEVHEHLFHDRTVRLDEDSFAARDASDLDPCSQNSTDDGHEFVQSLVDREGLGIELILAAQVEQVAGQVRGPIHHSRQGLHQRLRFSRFQGLHQAEVQLKPHHREDVVEIMGHTACNLTQNFHLLGLPEFGFNGDTLGLVHPRGREVGASLDVYRTGVDAHLQDPPVLATMLTGHVPYLEPSELSEELAQVVGLSLAVDVEEGEGCEFALGVTQGNMGRRVEFEESAVIRVDHRDRIRRLVHQFGK